MSPWEALLPDVGTELPRFPGSRPGASGRDPGLLSSSLTLVFFLLGLQFSLKSHFGRCQGVVAVLSSSRAVTPVGRKRASEQGSAWGSLEWLGRGPGRGAARHPPDIQCPGVQGVSRAAVLPKPRAWVKKAWPQAPAPSSLPLQERHRLREAKSPEQNHSKGARAGCAPRDLPCAPSQMPRGRLQKHPERGRDGGGSRRPPQAALQPTVPLL